MKEIEDLADETMANLGLSRVMHSIVGDVTRRGVSGGEKKRVNIGLELMSRPRILFLDEPTSGLGKGLAIGSSNFECFLLAFPNIFSRVHGSV